LRKHFFVDEAGNFDFSLRRGASKYFVLTSVTMNDCESADRLLDLRRELSWTGHPLTDAFRATSDKQAVRDRVFEAIVQMDLRVDATVFEKRKTQPDRQPMLRFYKLAWYLHAKHVMPLACDASDELRVIAASIGTKKEQIAIGSAINDVVIQCGRKPDITKVAHWPASTDPGLQIADYCCWAIQRKWESEDSRSFDTMKHLVKTEYPIFQLGTQYFY
jgi:hypothetical protein